MAAAALDRLGRTDRIAERLDPSVMLPQVGQGALAVECRDDDGDLLEALRAIEHAPSRRAVDAERAFLEALGGDCDLPAGAHAVVEGDRVAIDRRVGVPRRPRPACAITSRAQPAPAGRAVGERLRAKMSA